MGSFGIEFVLFLQKIGNQISNFEEDEDGRSEVKEKRNLNK